MARAREPQLKISRQPVTGVFKPTERTLRDPKQHHIGWDGAFQNALDKIGRPRGRYNVHVEFSAVVDVTNPGNVIEYHATII